MKRLHADKFGERQANQRAEARTVLLALVFFIAGLAASAVWFSQKTTKPDSAEAPVALTDMSKGVLQGLHAPIELRYYSLLNTSGLPANVQAFAGRVDRLLSVYEQQSGGRIKVTRIQTPTDANADAATADGIKAFNRDKGDACYLGIVVAQDAHKEALANLTPEWESALESDLSRAIGRTASIASPPTAVVDTPAMDAVKRAIPNPDSVSLEDGTQILHDAALAQFKQEAQDMGAKIKAAQEAFVQSQGQSEADRQSALTLLSQLQNEQMEKLKEIAAQSKAQTEAFQQLKQKGH